MDMPTVIKHYRHKLIPGANKTGKMFLLQHYLTDVGWLSLYEMSRRTGIKRQTLVTRLRSLKPGDKSMFSVLKTPYVVTPTEEWRRMGNRPRNRNLDRIPQRGTWEARI